jgi:hypothetical protein
MEKGDGSWIMPIYEGRGLSYYETVEDAFLTQMVKRRAELEWLE